MTYKFLKPSPTRWIALGWTIALASLFCAEASLQPVRAQPPSPAANERNCYIRFWNMLPDKEDNNLLVLANDKPLFGAAPLDLNGDYVPSPAGSYSIVVKRVGENSAVLQKIPATLTENSYITLLATEKNGQPVIESFNDTPDPKTPDLSARVIVRSFFPGEPITIRLVGGQPQTVADGGTVTLDNVPMTVNVNIIVQMSLITKSLTSKTWNVPADFSATHRATLFLTPDQYGRLRTRLIYNGRLAYPNAPKGARHE